MKLIIRNLFIICLFISSISVHGQESSDSASVFLGKLYGRLTNNYDDSSRIRINDSIKIIIDSYVRSDSVFNHRFASLRHLGQITSSDSTLKIVTWNLVLGSGPGSYFCYFIKKGEEGNKNKVYSLSAIYNDSPVKTDTTYTESDWYGALYYELRPYMADGKQCWVILGIDYGNPFISRKIIEVLDLKDDGTLLFGRKWFVAGDKVSYRAVMEYASYATMTLRFYSEKSIVFDHLVPFSQSQINDRQYYGPDYSTDAYNYENGKWILKINVDARNKE